MGTDGFDISNTVDELPESLAIDDVFEALAHPHRRQLLVVLGRLDTAERLPALTRNIAAETSLSGDEDVEQLQLLLHHLHVPKLADAGIAAYDRGHKTVDLTEQGERIAAALAR